MRKMKKINGFLVVKFNSRELREWGDTGLGNFGLIDAEVYTGKLEIDRGAMEYDDIETIEEAVEMARGLNAEEDYTTQPSTYAIVEEVVNDVVERVEVDPQFMIDRWRKSLKEQIKSPYYPGINPNTARHELYGFMVALSELGLLDTDECLVIPNAFGPEELPLNHEPGELLSYICDEICKERIPGRTQEELDEICAKCAVNRRSDPFTSQVTNCKEMRTGTAFVMNQGIMKFGTLYTDYRLLKYVGDQVSIRWDADDVTKLYVYTLDGQKICEAVSAELLTITPKVSQETIETKQLKGSSLLQLLNDWSEANMGSLAQMERAFMSFSAQERKKLEAYSSSGSYPNVFFNADSIVDKARK